MPASCLRFHWVSLCNLLCPFVRFSWEKGDDADAHDDDHDADNAHSLPGLIKFQWRCLLLGQSTAGRACGQLFNRTPFHTSVSIMVTYVTTVFHKNKNQIYFTFRFSEEKRKFVNYICILYISWSVRQWRQHHSLCVRNDAKRQF